MANLRSIKKVQAKQAATDSAAADVEIKRKVVKSPLYASLYANDIQVQFSPWDMRLVFGEIEAVPSAEDPTLVVTEVGQVHLSLPLAKRLTAILVQQIEAFERQSGTVAAPEKP